MEFFNIVAGGASIVGLLVSVYTLYKVETLPAALRRQSRDQHLNDLIEKIVGLPSKKPKISESTAQQVEFLIQTIRTYYLSKLWWSQLRLKRQLKTLEVELGGERRREIVQNRVQLLRHEIFIKVR